MLPAVFSVNSEPVCFVPDEATKQEVSGGFIDNLTVTGDFAVSIAEYLEKSGVRDGLVGTNLDLLPLSWRQKICSLLPGLSFTDVSEDIFAFRNHHSDEELSRIRKCAELADASYKAVLDNVKAGMTEQDIAAEIDHAAEKLGAEYNFTLISTGKFSLSDNRLKPIRAATMLNRTLAEGECIAMEITPRYEGYWTQLVRTVSAGEPDEDLKWIHGICNEVIEETLPELYPGNRIGNIAEKVKQSTESRGCIFSLPCGHICGQDLNEERLSPDNDRLLEPGMAVILHPTIRTDSIPNGIFWGQTYLITEDGFEPLMKSDTELKSI